MNHAEAREKMASKLTIWRERIGEKLDMARELRARGTPLAIDLAQAREREAQSLERDVLALSLILSTEDAHG